MFQGFPERIDWALVALTPEELADVRFIAWDWWLERSGGTRLTTEYARRIRAGAFPGDPESALRYHEPIARRLREGPPLPKLIVVRDAARMDFLVLVVARTQPATARVQRGNSERALSLPAPGTRGRSLSQSQG